MYTSTEEFISNIEIKNEDLSLETIREEKMLNILIKNNKSTKFKFLDKNK